MKLLVQPGEGVTPLVRAIESAKRSIEILIFRFDRREIESALAKAASRGVSVHALIASSNRGGEKNLRELETRLLAAGVTVARTADDLVRYHGKFMIVDRRELYLLAFNFTSADIERSRSFGCITNNRRIVQEAVKLFDNDIKRQRYESGVSSFLVSPLNSRKALAGFIRGARKELWIYDPRVSDPAMCRLLEERAKSGVDVRVLGRMSGGNGAIPVHRLANMRLHTRTILRDGSHVFLGSQSLRALELDARREVGVIFRDASSAKIVRRIFEEDWIAAEAHAFSEDRPQAARVAKRVAKVVTKELPPVVPIVEGAVRDVVGVNGADLRAAELEQVVKNAVKQAVKAAVEGVVQEVVEADLGAMLPEPRVVNGK